jgi:RNA polymerase sigma-70 factor (ECF subfamily)
MEPSSTPANFAAPKERDREIVEGLRRRDPAALERAMRQHGDFVARVAAKLVDSPEDAEDVVQETFLRLWDRPPGRFMIAALSTYLYRVARNAASESRRRRSRLQRRETLVERDSLEMSPDPSSSLRGETEERERLLHALEARVRALPERQREVVLLRVYEGKSVEETAALMGCRAGTVKAALSKAKENLRSAFGESAPPEATAPARLPAANNVKEALGDA